MKINKFDLGRLHNDAHFQFHTEFRDLVTSATAAALKITPQFDVYLPIYTREDMALKKIVKSPLTQRIHEADKERDAVFAGFCALIKGHTMHFSPDLRQLVAPVQNVLDSYGNVASKPVDEQTSAMYNLVQELNLAKYQEARTNFGLTIWLNKLKSANEAYETLVKQRYDETASKSGDQMKDVRRELDEAYRNMCDIVNVYVLLEGVANYETFIKKLNAVIANYSAKIHHHAHHTAAAQTEKEEEKK